jgi:predicted alpha/beta superfamily hydrolase
MTLRTFVLPVFIAGSFFSAEGQVTVSGTVVSSASGETLPFVNIGIKRKNVGTASLVNGTFSIVIPSQHTNDTLTFSTVGYEALDLPLKMITGQKVILLKQKVAQLEPVLVTTHKLVEQKVGIKGNSNIHFVDASTNQDDVFEIAQVIKLGDAHSKITSVNLLIYEDRSDSATFRINFYAVEQNAPGKRIVEKSIVQTKKIEAGWLKFDLSQYHIYLKKSFVIGIEFIPTGKKSKPITYELKLGGPTRSFVRKSSQGEWEVPFHHYRLYVTALVPEGENRSMDESEQGESVPDTILYSQFVRDSFRVFVSKPDDYSIKRRKCPVVYLLDANVYFDIVASAMRANRSAAILVGIGYRDFLQMDSLRDRDYTFPEALPEDSFKLSGGGERFRNFIERELVPYIDKTYRTEPRNRTLMGHSLGGYFSLYVLDKAVSERNSPFRNFVAASPSLEYHDRLLFKDFDRFSESSDAAHLNLLLSYGELEDREEGGTGTKRIDGFNEFTKLFEKEKFRNINVKSVVYPRFAHMETAIPTFKRATLEISR